jgi:hypothetical protein
MRSSNTAREKKMNTTTNPTDQIAAWKDADARDTDGADHPAGKLTLPKTRGQAARAYALAGYAAGVAVVTPVVPTLSDYSFCCGVV